MSTRVTSLAPLLDALPKLVNHASALDVLDADRAPETGTLGPTAELQVEVHLAQCTLAIRQIRIALEEYECAEAQRERLRIERKRRMESIRE